MYHHLATKQPTIVGLEKWGTGTVNVLLHVTWPRSGSPGPAPSQCPSPSLIKPWILQQRQAHFCRRDTQSGSGRGQNTPEPPTSECIFSILPGLQCSNHREKHRGVGKHRKSMRYTTKVSSGLRSNLLQYFFFLLKNDCCWNSSENSLLNMWLILSIQWSSLVTPKTAVTLYWVIMHRYTHFGLLGIMGSF